MLKRNITFKDYDGNTLNEEFRFNLNKVEVTTLQFSRKEGFSELLARIIKENDEAQIIEHFKELILASYGVLDPVNRRRFIKSPELREEFSQTEAFVELFMELATQANSAAEFVRGIMPDGFDLDEEQIANTQAELTSQPSSVTDMDTQAPVAAEAPSGEKKFEDYSKDQLLSMSQEEFDDIVGTNPAKMTQQQLMIAFERRSRS